MASNHVYWLTAVSHFMFLISEESFQAGILLKFFARQSLYFDNIFLDSPKMVWFIGISGTVSNVIIFGLLILSFQLWNSRHLLLLIFNSYKLVRMLADFYLSKNR